MRRDLRKKEEEKDEIDRKMKSTQKDLNQAQNKLMKGQAETNSAKERLSDLERRFKEFKEIESSKVGGWMGWP